LDGKLCVSFILRDLARSPHRGPKKITVSGLAEIQLAAIGAAHWEEVQQKG
jgi:hypothetical protein